MSKSILTRALTAGAIAGALFAVAPGLAVADTSQLWGQLGELWDPRGRLPDFSYAGYRAGREPIPDLPVVTNVRDFGAVGDGTTDDTAAFQAALAATEDGALLVPAGRYLVRDILTLDRSGVVLRGEGPAETVLYIDRSLTDVFGAQRADFAYARGFVELRGFDPPTDVGAIVEPASRGDRALTLDRIDGVEAGDLIHIQVVEPEGSKSLGLHLHNGQAEGRRCSDLVQFNWRTRVVEVDEAGGRLILDEPLPIDLRLEWSPVVSEVHWVSDVGVEDLAIEFPVTPYPGHNDELGYNGIWLVNAVDAWVKNVEITNSDSGIFGYGKHLTIEDVRLLSDRPLDDLGVNSHHGILTDQSCLVQDVHFDAHFQHHITVSNQAARNVYRNVSGTMTVRLDHHRRTPMENLFSGFTTAWNYRSGGNGCEGPHAGARHTYWGMKGPVQEPCNVDGSGQCWGHIQSNAVGDLAMADSRTEDREWYEEVAALEPADLYQAQLSRRLAIEDRDARFSPLRFGSRDRWVEHDPTRWAAVEEDGDVRYGLITTVHDFKDGQRLGEYALAATGALGDASLSAQVASPERLGSTYRDVALILGYQDDDNYDYAMFNSDEVSTEIFAVRDGQRHPIANAERGVLIDTEWHTIGFRRAGTRLEMLWDGELIASGDLADAGFDALPGQVGIGTYNDQAFFDDIDIESPDLADEEPDAGVGDDEDPADVDDEAAAGGCGCRADTGHGPGPAGAGLALLCLAALRRRRAWR